MIAQLPILKHVAVVADPIRCRLLRILNGQELMVGELCSVLQLPQSTVSRHLKTLLDDHWIVSRRDGTSRLYSMADVELAPEARDLWAVVEQQLQDAPVAREDRRRLEGVLEARRSRSRAFFSSTAGQWDRLRRELFGDRFQFHALVGLLDDRWMIGDLGCGTGQVSAVLAPYVRQVIAVDGSAEMLAAAAERLQGLKNVDLRPGELESLPVDDGILDAALLILVLHYTADPARVLSEAARVLRPGGRLLLVDMLPHEREEFQQQMGHVWPGFERSQTERYLTGAGMEAIRVLPLPPDAEAKGPALFAAIARKP